jgi:hypothetical protein
VSYHEENGQVILTMSREDYNRLLQVFALATVIPTGGVNTAVVYLLDRLNEGNQDYTPYLVKAK